MKLFPKKSRKPVQAIQFHCFECMGWDRTKKKNSERPYEEVQNCTDEMCPLFDFRFGKNPFLINNPRGNSASLNFGHKSRVETGNF